jgi:hypothetical protein
MGKIKYICPTVIKYWSERYKKSVTVPNGYPSDGATFAEDIYSDSWWIHDILCDTGVWDDGTPLTNWQASMVLRDVLLSEGRYIRANRWFVATFLFGGGKARENGMFRLKTKQE